MFTDMVDYTTMSEKNEALALTMLEEHRTLLRPVFARHGGHEVKTIGDGFLVEFPSALEAVRGALEIQQLMYKRNQSVPSERKILLRVAVHLGDVEHRDGDVYGDAVNIASRIQRLADPGGICITQQVFDHVRNAEEFRAEPLGQSQLKNVQMPTVIYRVLPPAERCRKRSTHLGTKIRQRARGCFQDTDGHRRASGRGTEGSASQRKQKTDRTESSRRHGSLCPLPERAILLEQEDQGRPREGNSVFRGSDREGSQLRPGSRGNGGLLYSDGTPSLPPR